MQNELDSRIVRWLEIVFPEIRDVEGKIIGLSDNVKWRMAVLIEDVPGDYGVANENRLALQEIYAEHIN